MSPCHDELHPSTSFCRVALSRQIARVTITDVPPSHGCRRSANKRSPSLPLSSTLRSPPLLQPRRRLQTGGPRRDCNRRRLTGRRATGRRGRVTGWRATGGRVTGWLATGGRARGRRATGDRRGLARQAGERQVTGALSRQAGWRDRPASGRGSCSRRDHVAGRPRIGLLCSGALSGGWDGGEGREWEMGAHLPSTSRRTHDEWWRGAPALSPAGLPPVVLRSNCPCSGSPANLIQSTGRRTWHASMELSRMHVVWPSSRVGRCRLQWGAGRSTHARIGH